MPTKKSVVVVGAGFAGIAVVNALISKFNPSEYYIILINPRSYALSLAASSRLVVSEVAKLEHTALVPLDRLFKKGRGETKIGIVKAIEPKNAQSGGVVVLESGERVAYEVLVIAPGSKWKGPYNFPLNESDVLPHIHMWRSKFSSAMHVVIVGGGAVGAELAGEIKDDYPDKKVTIIQGGSQLLSSIYPPSLREGIATRLLARGVKLVFNDYVDIFPDEGSVGLITRKGIEIPDADLVIWARGPSPNTGFVSSLGSSSLTESGFVKVKPTLQLVDYSHIFAAGDVIEWPEQKQAAKVNSHAAVIAQNVAKILAGKNDVLVNYKGSVEVIAIPNGRNGGMCYFSLFGGFTLGDFWTKYLKSRGLVVWLFRWNLGYW